MTHALIYGSCVSRDVFRLFPEQFEVSAYYARNSWISATNPPVALPEVRSQLKSSFQKRMVINDFKSTTLPALETGEADVVILDLIDERNGVYAVPGGGYVTSSHELAESGWKEAAGIDEVIKFGSDEHFALFSEAAKKVAATLDGRRAYLIKAHFAETTVQGTPTPRARNRSAAAWNADYERYYDIVEQVGIPLLEVPKSLAISSTEHTWGPQPYHYSDDFYEWVARHLNRAPRVHAVEQVSKRPQVRFRSLKQKLRGFLKRVDPSE